VEVYGKDRIWQGRVD
jgi:hypothetical protein